MGLLINGNWKDTWYDTKASGGKFERKATSFRNWVTTDGSQGPRGNAGFAAEPGRYHLYVSLACPWAHRTLILRKLKKLEDCIGVSVVAPIMLDKGWTFDTAVPGVGDGVNHADFLYQIYQRADPDYTGRVTVPVLWDTRRNTIVNNESAEIIRMFNSAFNDFTEVQSDYYPKPLQTQIDDINERVYHTVNNGVYKCGFATSQGAYEEAFHDLFTGLDELEIRLSQQAYLAGAQITEADWRLFTTLVRFDVVYFGHFKCNNKRIADYPSLSNYLRALYQWQGIAETVNFEHIKRHYYYSHTTINPTQIVPLGPEQDLFAAHNRDRFGHSAAQLTGASR